MALINLRAMAERLKSKGANLLKRRKRRLQRFPTPFVDEFPERIV